MGRAGHAGLRTVLRVIAIHPDQQQLLIDQSGESISFPQFTLPDTVVVRNQNLTIRLQELIEDEYGIAGEVVSILPQPLPTLQVDHGHVAVAFLASNAGSSARLDEKSIKWREISNLLAFSGHLSDQLRNALDVVKIRKTSRDLKEAWSSKIDRAMRFLEDRMVDRGDMSGWTQFMTPDNVGVLSTAQGALTALYSQRVSSSTRHNIQTIRKFQNTDGGWPVRRSLIGHSQISITESTVYCLWAMTAAGEESDDPALVSGIEWLERAQGSDGSWGSTSPSARGRVYPTAFAIRYLTRIAPRTPSIREGLNWLRTAQNPDGGWGSLPSEDSQRGSISTAVHTAHSLIAFMAAGTDKEDPQIRKAVDYLLNTVRHADREPWPSTSEVETVDDDAALDFRHFTTPWVIVALLEAGEDIGSPALLGAVRWLLDEQHLLGYWSSTLAPGQTPIWATFDAIHALSRLREVAADRMAELFSIDSTSAELEYAWIMYFALLDKMRRESVDQATRPWKWIYTWNALLTFTVAYLVLSGAGVLTPLNLSSATKLIGSALIGLFTGFGPFLYQLLTEEYKRFRNKRN